MTKTLFTIAGIASGVAGIAAAVTCSGGPLPLVSTASDWTGIVLMFTGLTAMVSFCGAALRAY